MSAPIKLAEGVWRLPTSPLNLVNSFLFEEPDGSLTLVDAGTRGMAPKRVASGLAAMGRAPSEVRRILLTHAHGDHAGGAARIQALTGGGLETHEDEAHWVRDGRCPPFNRQTFVGRMLQLKPPRIEAVAVRSTFTDGQLLDVAGGLRVLHTPGHTMGHCSFLHEPTGVLVTGDSLFNFLDRMSWSFAFFCTDFPMSKQTAERLGEVDYDVAAFTHGPEIRRDAREQIRSFLRKHTASG